MADLDTLMDADDLDKMIATIEQGTLTAYQCGEYARGAYGEDFPFDVNELHLTTIYDANFGDIAAAMRIAKAFFPKCKIHMVINHDNGYCDTIVATPDDFGYGVARQDGNLGRAIILSTLYQVRAIRRDDDIF